MPTLGSDEPKPVSTDGRKTCRCDDTSSMKEETHDPRGRSVFSRYPSREWIVDFVMPASKG